MPITKADGEQRSHHQMPSSGHVRRLATRDFDELAAALRDWDAEFHQLGRGPFRGGLEFAAAGPVQVLRITANRVIQARGRLRPGYFAFSPVTKANEGATWRGHNLKAGQLNLNRPGAVMDHLSSADYETLIVQVDAETLRKQANVFLDIDLDERLANVLAFRTGRATAARLESVLRRILFSPTDGEGRMCVCLLLDTLAVDPTLEAKVPAPDRQRLARRAEDFLLAHLDLPLTAAEVCTELGVSERTLRYAFRDQFGLSPMAYFKTKRLNAVRHALKSARRSAETVHEIAGRWGFEHTGNLAADYRRLFGELPSQTAARRAARSSGKPEQSERFYRPRQSCCPE